MQNMIFLIHLCQHFDYINVFQGKDLELTRRPFYAVHCHMVGALQPRIVFRLQLLMLTCRIILYVNTHLFLFTRHHSVKNV